MKRRLAHSVTAAAFAVLSSTHAMAALTSSELAMVRQFFAGGQVQNAARVRALVGRTDLSAEESAQALSDAASVTPVGDAQITFAREMLFGSASAASRPVLAVAMTRALVRRADALLSKHAADLDSAPDAVAELLRIYRFLGFEVAGAGRAAGGDRDAAGIPPSSYEACTKALAEHVTQNPRWLKGDAALPPSVVRVRAQLQLALMDMMGDAVSRRVDAANKLGLAGARRKAYLELGVLFVDSGRADDGRVTRARALFERIPVLKPGVAAIAFGEDASRLAARGTVLGLAAPLEGTGKAAAWPFSEEVEPGPADAETQELARGLGVLASRAALSAKPELAILADHDVKAAQKQPFGRPDGAGIDAGLGAALELLATDAPRALDLAFIRFLAKKPESAAVLSDALGVLAALAPPPPAKGSLSLTLGKPKGVDGSLAPVELTNVRIAPTGAVVGFTLDGHEWVIARDRGPVTAVRRDGAPIDASQLPTAHVPTLEQTSWTAPGLVLARMHGTPKAGAAAGGKVRLVGTGEPGYDVIAAVAPGADVAVEGDLTVKGGMGGIAVRAQGNKDGFRGAAVMITPWPSPRIALVLREEDGFESFLAAPNDVPEVGTVHVRLAIRGTKVEAKVGDAVFRGTVPASLSNGQVAIFGRKGAEVSVERFAVKAP